MIINRLWTVDSRAVHTTRVFVVSVVIELTEHSDERTDHRIHERRRPLSGITPDDVIP